MEAFEGRQIETCGQLQPAVLERFPPRQTCPSLAAEEAAVKAPVAPIEPPLDIALSSVAHSPV